MKDYVIVRSTKDLNAWMGKPNPSAACPYHDLYETRLLAWELSGYDVDGFFLVYELKDNIVLECHGLFHADEELKPISLNSTLQVIG